MAVRTISIMVTKIMKAKESPQDFGSTGPFVADTRKIRVANSWKNVIACTGFIKFIPKSPSTFAKDYLVE